MRAISRFLLEQMTKKNSYFLIMLLRIKLELKRMKILLRRIRTPNVPCLPTAKKHRMAKTHRTVLQPEKQLPVVTVG